MIYTKLLPHQIRAFDVAKNMKSCAIFMRPGTGKSLVALALADYHGARRVLITSDKNNTINTWPDEIHRHTDFDVVVRVNLVEWKFLPICLCMNYDMLASREEILTTVNFDMWIGDESTEFKDGRTLRHKSLARIVRSIPIKLILSGSPMTERLEDVWGQFKILDDGKSLGSSMTQFRSRYMSPLDSQGWKWGPQRSALTRIQKAVKHISHWWDGEVKGMPTRKYYRIVVPTTIAQVRLDDELRNEFSMTINKETIDLNYAVSVFIKRIQLMGGILRKSVDEWLEVDNAKIPALLEVVKNHPDLKIVVWHEYIPETATISKHMKAVGLSPLIYDDPTHSEVLAKFRKQERGVLLMRNSMCRGLNHLADCDMAIFYSNPLSYSRRVQAEGRSRRISSQTLESTYVDLITETGVDSVVLEMLNQKRDFSLTLHTISMLVC